MRPAPGAWPGARPEPGRATRLRDLVEDARKRPAQIRVGLDAILGDDHLALLLLEQEASVRFRAVHFEGAAPQIPALLGGQVDVVFQNASFPFVPRARAGEVRMIAVFARERSPFLPDVPTAAEQGFQTTMSVTSGLAAPKGLPGPVAEKLQAVFTRAMQSAEHREKLPQIGVPAKILVGAEYTQLIDELDGHARRLVEQFRKSR